MSKDKVYFSGLIARGTQLHDYVRPYRKYFVQVLAIIIFTVCVNFLIQLTNRATVNAGILVGDVRFINLMILLQSVMYALLILLNSLRSKISSHISTRLVTRMSGQYMSHIVSLPMRFFLSSSSGDITERNRDLERVQRFVSVELVDAIASSISILSLGLLLLWIDGTIFLVFAASALIYLLWITGIGVRRRQVDLDRFRENSRSRAIEIGIVDAIQDIKIAGYEERSLATWADVQIAALRTRLRSASIEHLQASGGHFCTRVGMVLVTFISAKKVVSGEVTLGDFTITSVIVVQLYYYLNQLLDFVNRLGDVQAALRRAQDVLETEPEAAANAPAYHVPAELPPVVFRTVSFSYPGATRPSLTDISFDARRGTMTALAGASGSGKSTILKLLLSLYEPTSGSIMVGGNSLQSIDRNGWRARIGAVMQEGALFATTVKGNIAAGCPIENAWLEDVLLAARLHDVIAGLPDGLDTMVGPGGARLSAGQTQRIIIGRALYKRPSLLLLDEATSALDGRNESAVMENIRALLPDATSIVAAHRLNTIKNADQILIMNSGRIVERGTPRELLRVRDGWTELAEPSFEPSSEDSEHHAYS